MKYYSVYDLECILRKNNFGETEIACPDGIVITVIPMSYAEKITSAEDCDYFLVNGDMPWMGCKNLMALRKEINDHAKHLAELIEERKELRKYFDEQQANGWESGDWSFYSDWHKDLYGYRPHGRVCGEYVRPW